MTLASGLILPRRGTFPNTGAREKPDAWRWFEPGEWDCHNRDDVMRTLRERYDQGFALGNVEFRDVGEDAVIVVSHPSEIGGPEWPAETATVMKFRSDRVVSMQDYRTEADARAATGQT